MMPSICAVIPTHLGRRVPLFERAIGSVVDQTLQVAQISVAVDRLQQGAAATRQRALMAAQTEWVAFLDSDDIWLPHHLEVLYLHAEQTGADYVYSWFNVAGGMDPFPNTHYTEPWDPANPRQTTITTLVRTELAKEVGFHMSIEGDTIGGLRAGEDWLFTLGCNERGKISHLVERTWVWHHHGGNTSGLPNQGDAR